MAITKKTKKTSKQILASVTDNRKHLQDPNIVDPKNRRDLSTIKRMTPLMELHIYEAIDWMREGKSYEWITQQLLRTQNTRTKRNLAPRFVENIVTGANQLIMLWYQQQIYQVEKIHIARYNQIIIDKLNKKYTFDEGMPPWLCTKIMCDDLTDCLNAMRQKEVLLGMHRKSFKITINNQTNVTINKPKSKPEAKVDIHNLTFTEQAELLQLIAATNKSDNELHGVILKQKVIEVDQDQFEDAVVIATNIDSIDTYKDVKKDIGRGSTLSDIEQKIQDRLLKAQK